MDSQFKLIYDAYLSSPAWKEKRQQKALQAKNICEICGKREYENFEIHHKHYKTFMCEELEDLMFLCVSCHRKLHKNKKLQQLGYKPQVKHKQNIRVKKNCKICKFGKLEKHRGCKKVFVYCIKKQDVVDNVCNQFKLNKRIHKKLYNNK